MYLAQITRYDVMYAVCQLARAMPKPSKAHMGAAKQLLRYLAGTTDFSIVYKRGSFKLSAFSDANWGNNPDNCKSTSAYLVMLSGSHQLQVRNSKPDRYVHHGSGAGCLGLDDEGSCILL